MKRQTLQNQQQLTNLRQMNPQPQQIQHQMQGLLNQQFLLNSQFQHQNYNQYANTYQQAHDHNHSHSNCSNHNHNHNHNHKRKRKQYYQIDDPQFAQQFQQHLNSTKKYRTKPVPKNIVVFAYTIFTIFSCVYLETYYFRIYQNSPIIGQYLSYFSYIDGFLCLYSYLVTIFVSNKIIRKQLLPPSYQKVGSFDPQHSIKRKTCNPCNYYKMPRMSHCNTCASCIYKLDHHCVWAQNCIGYKNQKAFYLFTFYMTIGLVIFWYETSKAFSALKYPIVPQGSTAPNFFDVLPWYIYLLWGVTCMSACFVGIMIVALCISHIMMISTNFTTLDSMKKRRCFPIPVCQWRSSSFDAHNSNQFDRGQIQNIKQIFGDYKCFFNIPILFSLIPTVRQIENEYTIQKMNPQPSKLQLMKFTNEIGRQIERDKQLRSIIKKLSLIYSGKKMRLVNGQVIKI